MRQPPNGQTQTLMPALMPLLSTSTSLERLSFAGCCFDHGDLEWLHLAPKALQCWTWRVSTFTTAVGPWLEGSATSAT